MMTRKRSEKRNTYNISSKKPAGIILFHGLKKLLHKNIRITGIIRIAGIIRGRVFLEEKKICRA